MLSKDLNLNKTKKQVTTLFLFKFDKKKKKTQLCSMIKFKILLFKINKQNCVVSKKDWCYL